MMLPDAHCGAGRAAGLGKVHLPETDGGERTVVGRDPQIAGGRRDEPDDSRTGLPDAALPVGATFGDRAAGDVHRRHQPDARGAGAVSGDWPRLGMRSGSGILRRAARRLPGTECAAAARGTGRGACQKRNALPIWGPYLAIGRAWECEVEAVFFDVPLDVCLERNAQRQRVVPGEALAKMAAKLVPPSVEDRKSTRL